MPSADRLLFLMDRYLAVSNGYHHHTELRRVRGNTNGAEQDGGSRQARLIKLIEGLDLEPQRGRPDAVESLRDEDALGQTVAPTSDLLRDTKRHQEILRDRLRTFIPSGAVPENFQLLISKLDLPPESFLALFESVTYAWDTLVELGSLAVLPNPQTIQAREIILIQTTDLETHLREMLAATLLAETAPSERVEVALIETVARLRELERSEELTDWLIRASVAEDPGAMLDMIVSYVRPHLPELAVGFTEEAGERSDGLRRKRHGFNDILDEGCTLRRAIEIVDEIVSFGLRIGYAMWYVASLGDDTSRAALRKNVLFCTRTLLDEERWAVARDVADFGIDLARLDNEATGRDREWGTAMLQANGLWARSQLHEGIEVKVRAWNTAGLHLRYEFLKDVLLGNAEAAARKARELLLPEGRTGFPNMCMREMREWPILAGFRTTEEWRALEQEVSVG